MDLEDKLRAMIDQMISIRPKTSAPLPQQKPIIDILVHRLEDLIAFTKEVYDENHILVDHTKDIKGQLSSKEEEIQVVISDNKKLSQ